MAEAAVQTLDISPVGRVEGDLDVRVEVQDGRRRQRLDSSRTCSAASRSSCAIRIRRRVSS